jgi:hypothetical protein
VPSDTPVRHDLPDPFEYRRREPETTVLYRVVQRNLETFPASAREQGRLVPRFVERELRAYLECGLLCRGFLRVRCDACSRERLVAFCCKTRSLCPSCGARSMSDTAAHLVDRVFPEAPVRQYVLSLPFTLRTRRQTHTPSFEAGWPGGRGPLRRGSEFMRPGSAPAPQTHLGAAAEARVLSRRIPV